MKFGYDQVFTMFDELIFNSFQTEAIFIQAYICDTEQCWIVIEYFDSQQQTSPYLIIIFILYFCFQIIKFYYKL